MYCLIVVLVMFQPPWVVVSWKIKEHETTTNFANRLPMIICNPFRMHNNIWAEIKLVQARRLALNNSRCQNDTDAISFGLILSTKKYANSLPHFIWDPFFPFSSVIFASLETNESSKRPTSNYDVIALNTVKTLSSLHSLKLKPPWAVFCQNSSYSPT